MNLDEIQSDIQNEKTLSAELDAKLREWEKKIRQKQAETGGANVAVTFNANVKKQERVLENRLDTVGVSIEYSIKKLFLCFVLRHLNDSILY